MPSDLLPGPDQPAGPGLERLLRAAQMHGETTDTRQWVDNLERMLAVAWELMTEQQRQDFVEHADVLAIAEAAGQSPGDSVPGAIG